MLLAIRQFFQSAFFLSTVRICRLTPISHYEGINSGAPGQVSTRTVDGRATSYSYYADGSLKATWGAEYPQKFEYLRGRLHKLHTYQAEPGADPSTAGNVTEWVYKHGLLWKKTDALNRSVVYGYDGRGRVRTRTWARGITTTYSYDLLGRPIVTQYSDGTTQGGSVTYAYDHLGRMTSAQAASSDQFTRSFTGNMEQEDVSGPGTNNGWGWVRRYRDSLGRTIQTDAGFYKGLGFAIDFWNGGTQANFYKADGRLDRVESFDWHINLPEAGIRGVTTFTYDAASGSGNGWSHRSGLRWSPDWGETIQKSVGVDGIGRTKRLDTFVLNGANRGFTEYTYGGGAAHEAALRKTAATDKGTWTYGYNARGEVTQGVKNTASGPVPGYNFGYLFDAIGNRSTGSVELSPASLGSAATVYGVDDANGLDTISNPGVVHVRGQITDQAPATNYTAQVRVQPDGPWLDARPVVDGNFARSLFLDNQAGPKWALLDMEVTATAANSEVRMTDSRKIEVPPAQVSIPGSSLTDEDGNLLTDGTWTYGWDAENRLVSMTRTAASIAALDQAGISLASIPGKLLFAYDPLGRRLRKTVFASDLTTLLSTTYFVHDGWRLVLECKTEPRPGNSPVLTCRHFTWGPDLSGDFDSAGGVGGLLAATVARNAAPYHIERMVPVYDGNGNITRYLNAWDGTVSQDEEYGPFGENLRPRRDSEFRSPLGWSTKYTDEETGLVYYGYRYYSPQMGRWINRDPIGERGGVNLYSAFRNNAVRAIDVDGRYVFQYDAWQTFAEQDVQTLVGVFRAVHARARQLQPKIASQVKLLRSWRCPCFLALANELEKANEVLKNIERGIAGGRTLEVEWHNFSPETTGEDAPAGIKSHHGKRFWDPLLGLDSEGPTEWRRTPKSKKEIAILHELTHLEGRTEDRDPISPSNNARSYEGWMHGGIYYSGSDWKDARDKCPRMPNEEWPFFQYPKP